MCIEFRIDGAQMFSRIRMCIEFVIQVPQQKNAHVSFPVGMVFSIFPKCLMLLRDRNGTPKNLCDKDFVELSGELSGAICLKNPCFIGRALELFSKNFGTVRAEIITELILERAGPVIFKTVLLELIAFRLIPVIFLQEEESLKITGNNN